MVGGGENWIRAFGAKSKEKNTKKLRPKVYFIR